jgi:hypothetical protein
VLPSTTGVAHLRAGDGSGQATTCYCNLIVWLFLFIWNNDTVLNLKHCYCNNNVQGRTNSF